MFKRWFLSIWIGLLAFCVYGQDPYSITIDKSRGLPSNAVYDIFQDSKGFMWFATDAGLCKYDGLDFTTYYSPELTSTAGTCIKEDGFGRIWYKNFDNNMYYIADEKLHALNNHKSQGIFIKYAIMGNYLLVPNYLGVDIYDLKKLTLVKRDRLEGSCFSVASNHQYTFVQIDMGKHIEVYTSNGEKYKIHADNDTLKSSVSNIKNNEVYLIDQDNKKKCYYSINQQGEIKKYFFLPNEFITNICFTGNNTWLCTKNGIYKINESNTGQPYELFYENLFTSCIYQDKNGNYWLGTTNSGVIFIPAFLNRMFKIQEKPNKLQLIEDKLYIGSKLNSIIAFDLKENKQKTIFKDSANHEVYDFLMEGEHIFLSSNEFYDLKNEKIQLTRTFAIKEMIVLDHKYLAYAASGICGTYQYGRSEEYSIWDSIVYANPNPAPGYEKISNLLKDVRGKSIALHPNKQTLYTSTNNGLYKITRSHITEVLYQEKTILSTQVKCYGNKVLVLQNNGILLVMDEFENIYPYPLFMNGTFLPIQKCILRNDCLFLLTNSNGTYELNLKTMNLHPNKIQSIHNSELVNDIVVWNNQYIVATENGILFLNNDKNTAKSIVPSLIVNGFSIHNEPQLLTKHVKVPYYKNDVKIKYAVLYFEENFNYPLYYRINKSEWKLLPANSRELELVSLEPDDYEVDFRFEGLTAIKTIKFTINKPIWQIHWFWLGIFIITLIIVFGIYKWRINILRKRNQLLIEKVELEKNLNKSLLTSIKAQMNPHFFYNALNTIQSFIFADDKKNASTYLSKFSKLTRLILEMSEKEVISLSEEIQALQLYLDIEKVRFNNKLNFNLQVDDKIDVEMTRFPPMLIQPYVENAIKHGLLHKKEDCQLLVKFSIESAQLMVTIDDNGIGRIKSAQLNAIKETKHQSFATGANQKRLEILNPENKEFAVKYIDKVDEAGNALGTTVIISLPLNT